MSVTRLLVVTYKILDITQHRIDMKNNFWIFCEIEERLKFVDIQLCAIYGGAHKACVHQNQRICLDFHFSITLIWTSTSVLSSAPPFTITDPPTIMIVNSTFIFPLSCFCRIDVLTFEQMGRADEEKETEGNYFESGTLFVSGRGRAPRSNFCPLFVQHFNNDGPQAIASKISFSKKIFSLPWVWSPMQRDIRGTEKVWVA